MHSRHHASSSHASSFVILDRPHAWFATILLAWVTAFPAGAQRIDSAAVAPRPVRVDSLVRGEILPPLTPRRAFLYSVLVPGLGQSRLGRPVAGAIFVFTESVAIAMLRESAADLRQARRFRSDSAVVIGFDPSTGAEIRQAMPFNDDLIKLRQGHVEDWIAFLVLNHLFAGADAYVAAHLWDLPSQIDVSLHGGRTRVAARLRW